jgi:hypothetical protein
VFFLQTSFSQVLEKSRVQKMNQYLSGRSITNQGFLLLFFQTGLSHSKIGLEIKWHLKTKPFCV